MSYVNLSESKHDELKQKMITSSEYLVVENVPLEKSTNVCYIVNLQGLQIKCNCKYQTSASFEVLISARQKQCSRLSDFNIGSI